MMRNIVFQVHWVLGLSAGLVLAVMGVSGALLSFENEWLLALNAGRTSVPVPVQPMLPAPELLERIAGSNPERRIGTLSVSSVPGRAAKVGFLPAAKPGVDAPGKTPANVAAGAGGAPAAMPGPGPGGKGGRVRMQIEYADPYDGRLLARDEELAGHGFFEFAEDLHRRLVSGETGTVITGACAFVLLLFALSGLYLRWPRRLLDWRAWLVPRWRQRGRPFLFSLHSVAGTWVLLCYLVAGLTGPYFGFDWYRAGVQRLLRVDPPARSPNGLPNDGAALPDLRIAWAAFERETAAAGHSTASFNVPSGDQPLTIHYLVADPPHERAVNRIVIDVATGAVRSDDRYARETRRERLVASLYPLHRGSFFGLPGVVVMMLAALSLPLFPATGWIMYRRRRRIPPVAAMTGVEPIG